MQYYVIGFDGSKYGPADTASLNHWILENRVTPQTLLESVDTGDQIVALSLPGLVFPVPLSVTNGSAPPLPSVGSNYPRPGSPMAENSDSGAGATDLVFSWVLFGFSFLCCYAIPNIVGIYLAEKSLAKGNKGGKAAKVANMIMLAAGILHVLVTVGASQMRSY